MRTLTVRQAARILNRTVGTLQRWGREGVLIPYGRTSENTGDNITLPVANGNVKSVELEAVDPTRKQKLNKTISNFSNYD